MEAAYSPPLWCAVIICLVITIIMKAPVDWKSVLTYFLCAQGVSRVTFNFGVSTLLGMGQAWFLTVLVVCYVLMLVLKKNPSFENYVKKYESMVCVIAVVLQIALCYVGVQIIYFLQFFVGYFLSKLDTEGRQNNWISKKVFIYLTVASIILGGARLIANRYLDGTIFYNRIIARWSFSIIAIWLIAVLIIICKAKWAEKMVQSKPWKLLDLTSYPLFLTHYMFLTGPMKVMGWLPSVPLQLTVFAMLTALTAVIITVLTTRKNLIEILRK